MPPQFEYDPVKSLKNWLKHDAWLGEAAAIWADPQKKFARGKSKNGELRFYVYGLYKDQVWKAVCTLREGRVRVISFHPTPRRERHAYYGR